MAEKLRRLQEEVADLAIELIARYQLVASDLRFIRSCMEISYGFSRFGRYSYDVLDVLETVGFTYSECDITAVLVYESQRQAIENYWKLKVFDTIETSFPNDGISAD